MLGRPHKLIGKIKSHIDKIDDVTIKADGTVTHN